MEISNSEQRGDEKVGHTFRATECKFFGIVAHKCDTFARIGGPGAEVACVYMHHGR